MKKIMLMLGCLLLGCVGASDSAIRESEKIGMVEEAVCSATCLTCEGCEPVASECFNIETNSVPYICRPGDRLPSGKSCFQASTNSYEWCCCNTGSCVPN